MLYFGGIDPTGTENRPSGCALLDSQLRIIKLEAVKKDSEIEEFFTPIKAELYAIGLDGPCKLPQGLHRCCFDPRGSSCDHSATADLRQQPRGKKGRTCERELAKQGIGCFFVTKKAFAKGWIYRSLILYEHLTKAGFRVLEIFPYASKRRLFCYSPQASGSSGGKNLPKKTTLEGRRVLQDKIASLGIALNHSRHYSHDELDAVIGAYTCYLHWQGKAEEIGDEIEGKIVLPVKMEK